MSSEEKKPGKIQETLNSAFEKVGDLTRLQRLLICIVSVALIGCGYYYFIFMPKHEELKRVEAIYEKQKKVLATYKKRAAEILVYERKMAAAQEKFNVAMRELPDKREIPSLLTGISRAGSDSGLAFHLFQPTKEVNREFYNEIPVSIKVVGRYHQLTDFFLQITKLNRIVNINNVLVKSGKGGNILEMTCKAVTYMFVEKKEPTGNKKKKKRKK